MWQTFAFLFRSAKMPALLPRDCFDVCFHPRVRKCATGSQTQNSELIYRLEDRPPLPQTLFAACQHLLAMFVAVITPALLICQALGLPAQDTQHIISMSLFASGVASIIQIKAWGPVGSGLLSIQGTSFNFVAPLIMGGTALKTVCADVPTMMAALFGTLMLASCTEM